MNRWIPRCIYDSYATDIVKGGTMKVLYGVRLLLFILILIPAAYAEDQKFSLYGGIGLGIAQYNGDHFSDAGPSDDFLPNQSFIENTAMFAPFFGYQANQYLSFEVRYIDFGEVSEKFELNPDIIFIVTPNDTLTIEIKGFTAGPLFEHPITDSLSVLGTVGFSYLRLNRRWSGGFNPNLIDTTTDTSQADKDVFFGFGIKYKLTKRFNFRIQLERYRLDTENIHLANTSIEFRF